jgi:L-tartrate/succinate antiporter
MNRPEPGSPQAHRSARKAAGLDQRAFALQLCLSLGLMGILTPYASGPSPIYHGSGCLPARDFWRLGAIFLVVYLAPGWPWMALRR